MFNVNGWEILIIAVVALLVLGPDRLPEFLARAGRLLSQLRRAADEATSEISREIKAVTEMAEAQLEEAARPGRPPRSVPPTAGADPGGGRDAPAAETLPAAGPPVAPGEELPSIAPPAPAPAAPDPSGGAPPAAEGD